MKKSFKFKVSNLSCESCKQLISKIVSKFPNGRLLSLDLKTGNCEIECSEKDLDKIKQEIKSKNYGIDELIQNSVVQSKNVLCCESRVKKVSNILIGIAKGDKELMLERGLVLSAIVSLVAIAILFFALFNSFPLSPLVLISGISCVVLLGAFYHHRIYSASLSCMSGMMAGMTIGMIGGFLFGAIIGASNGMFWGSIAGMAIGMFFGAASGLKSGIMGFLEGLMAGLMGGTMGAMLSIMMLSENFFIFLCLFMAVCIFILCGLSYMVFKEGIAKDSKLSTAKFALISIAFWLFSTFFILFGPRGVIFWRG